MRTTYRVTRAIWLFPLVFALTACNTQPTPSASPVPTSATPQITATVLQSVRMQQTVNGQMIAIDLPNTPKTNQPVVFRITLRDAQGKPVNDADVYLDMDMTTMSHGSVKPIAEAKGDGVYEASTTYSMSGDWRVIVVTNTQGTERRATFAQNVKE